MRDTERIDPPDWMTAPETRTVVDGLSAEGAEVRFVGGCVRDSLAGRPVNDIDVATPDPPETVMRLLEAAGLKVVPTGLKHGTVTAVSGGRPFEITTLREDVETFGRHARVAFTDDWTADAARRDFTINALSCRPDGRTFDPFGGMADLKAGRVRFVGDARARIEEDYLRLLRFFRFHAHYGRGEPDPPGLAAAIALAPRLSSLSGERIREELLKLLAAPDPVAVLRIMEDHAILRAVLPRFEDLATLGRLAVLDEERRRPDPLRRLAALLPQSASRAAEVAENLRLSNAQAERLRLLVAPGIRVSIDRSELELRAALYRLGRAAVEDLLLLAWSRAERSGRALLDRAFAVVAAWRDLDLPVAGRDVLALGVARGPRVGILLTQVEDWWIAADFQPDRKACLARLRVLEGAG